jgi:penicillin-binding protein 1A
MPRRPYLQGALVAIDPRNGYVRALVGGRDWNQSNFNRATQAMRQPGSAFKPFVYTAAMDNGFRPTDIVVDEPVSFPGGDGKPYEPQNYDHQYRGPVTLRYALQQSINIPAIKLLRKVGTSLVASYARRMGIKSPLGQNLSLALGSSEVNLLELTSAYAVLANRGIRNEPLYVLKVEDRNGTVLEKNAPRPDRGAVRADGGVMTSMLQSVMDHGTGRPARAMGSRSRRGQDGHDGRLHGRVVRGLRAEARRGRVGRVTTRSSTIGARHDGRARGAAGVDGLHDLGDARPAGRGLPRPAGTVTREVCAETGMLATSRARTSRPSSSRGLRADRVLHGAPGPGAPAAPRTGRPTTSRAPRRPRRRSRAARCAALTRGAARGSVDALEHQPGGCGTRRR